MTSHAGPERLPGTIREINDLPHAQKCACYATLIPAWVYARLGISPYDPAVGSHSAVHFRCPAGSSSVEISVYGAADANEPALTLHMGDTPHAQLIVMMVVANDPASPRFNIDVDDQGRDTQLGTRSRNTPEELRALRAGLGPGQVRAGLRLFRAALPTFEDFVSRMGHALFFIEPLFYHNAITFERYGFAYSRGLQKMLRIHREFQPGGALHARLDGSTPFRPPDAWRSITGRSWAIHDGILGEPFDDVLMYKRVGVHAGIETFPGAVWSSAALPRSSG